MSMDPNTLIVLQLTPNNNQDSQEVFDRMSKDFSTDEDDSAISISEEDYHFKLMNDEGYDEGYQISADPNTIILHDYVTYGYGATIEWSELEHTRNNLAQWAEYVCKKYDCSYKIYITANYW